MDQTQAKGCGCLLQVVAAIGFWVAAFAVYPPKSALMVVLVLGALNFLALLAGAIPLFGPFLYWQASKSWVFPTFFGWFPDIQPTWLTTVIFWGGFCTSLFLTLATTLVLFAAVRR